MTEKNYKIAVLFYNPDKDFPWGIQRYGVVPEQGGPQFGAETASFKFLEDAIDHLESSTKRDIKIINKRIKEIEEHENNS